MRAGAGARAAWRAEPAARGWHWLLVCAAEAGNAQLVARLLGEGRDVNEADETGGTALLWAARRGQVDVVQLLLGRNGVEVNKATARGFSSLMFASENGHVEVVQLLLARQGVEVNNKTVQNGATALFMASQNGHVEVVRLLLRTSRPTRPR